MPPGLYLTEMDLIPFFTLAMIMISHSQVPESQSNEYGLTEFQISDKCLNYHGRFEMLGWV